MIIIISIFLLISLLITSIYTLSWVKFQKYQFLERDYNIVAKHKEYSKKWHTWKAVNQGIFFFVMFLVFGYSITLTNMIFYWIIFDGFLNITVLKKPFFYVGQTAETDIKVQQLSKFFRISPLYFAFILKIILFVVSILLLFDIFI